MKRSGAGMFSHSAVKCSPIQASCEAELVEALDLGEVGLEGHAEVRAWRVHRHHEVAVPHVPIGSIPVAWTHLTACARPRWRPRTCLIR